MKKKVISLLLTAAMATTMFAGCGSSSEENTTADNNQTAAPAATETAAEDSTEAAAPAVSADGKIAMITDSGDITDESFNRSHGRPVSLTVIRTVLSISTISRLRTQTRRESTQSTLQLQTVQP